MKDTLDDLRPLPAERWYQRKQRMLRAFLKEYGCDKDFGDALVRFYHAHQGAIQEMKGREGLLYLRYHSSDTPDVSAFYSEMQALAKRWLLDKFDGGYGLDALHSWLRSYHDSGGRASVQSFGEWTFVTIIDSVIPSIGEPIRVAIEAKWRAHLESRSEIRERLIRECERQIDSQLSPIEEQYKLSAFRFPDTEPMIDDYVNWAFRRFIRQEDYRDIAATVHRSEGTVRNKTTELARLIGFNPPKTRKRTI